MAVPLPLFIARNDILRQWYADQSNLESEPYSLSQAWQAYLMEFNIDKETLVPFPRNEIESLTNFNVPRHIKTSFMHLALKRQGFLSSIFYLRSTADAYYFSTQCSISNDVTSGPNATRNRTYFLSTQLMYEGAGAKTFTDLWQCAANTKVLCIKKNDPRPLDPLKFLACFREFDKFMDDWTRGNLRRTLFPLFIREYVFYDSFSGTIEENDLAPPSICFLFHLCMLGMTKRGTKVRRLTDDDDQNLSQYTHFVSYEQYFLYNCIFKDDAPYKFVRLAGTKHERFLILRETLFDDLGAANRTLLVPQVIVANNKYMFLYDQHYHDKELSACRVRGKNYILATDDKAVEIEFQSAARLDLPNQPNFPAGVTASRTKLIIVKKAHQGVRRHGLRPRRNDVEHVFYDADYGDCDEARVKLESRGDFARWQRYDDSVLQDNRGNARSFYNFKTMQRMMQNMSKSGPYNLKLVVQNLWQATTEVENVRENTLTGLLDLIFKFRSVLVPNCNSREKFFAANGPLKVDRTHRYFRTIDTRLKTFQLTECALLQDLHKRMTEKMKQDIMYVNRYDMQRLVVYLTEGLRAANVSPSTKQTYRHILLLIATGARFSEISGSLLLFHDRELDVPQISTKEEENN